MFDLCWNTIILVTTLKTRHYSDRKSSAAIHQKTTRLQRAERSAKLDLGRGVTPFTSALRCQYPGTTKMHAHTHTHNHYNVRPVLEYNSVTWSPHLKQDITRNRIEKVQRQFTKRLRGFKCLTYTEHLAKLPSLELRRLHLDLIYCYKIVFGLDKFEFSDFLKFSLSSTRGHIYKLYKVRCSSARANFFACRLQSH